MPTHTMDLEVLIQVLDDDHFLAEGLFFPEVTRFGGNLRSVTGGVARSAELLLKQLPPGSISQRHLAGEVVAGSETVVVRPPARSLAWRAPVELTLPLVRWAHGDEAHLAYLPTLGLEVQARSPEELKERLPRELRAALFRAKAGTSLRRLCELGRCTELRQRTVVLGAQVPTPKERELAIREPPQKTSVLDQVGDRLRPRQRREAFGIDKVVERLGQTLAEPRPASPLLVGPSGVGKTAAFGELARRREDVGLRGRELWATSGSRLVAGQSGFGMWQERCELLIRECRERSVVLHLGNLVELMEVGKSEHNSQGIATFLRPFIQRGDLLAVAECTDEQLKLIEQRDAHLLSAFRQIPLEPPDRAAGLAILRECADQWTSKSEARVAGEALEALDRLHRRYSPYSASPGRPLRFLRRVVQDLPEGGVVDRADVVGAYLRETGLPRFMVDEAVPLDLDRTSRWFAGRVLGQPEAIELVVDLLASIKAGMGRPRKPLASLLLIGPTGVGKTELAKVLSQFLFGSEERLTRFDMTEYNDPLAVGRLTGGPGAGEGLLTAKVREQPFSVVLFDEVEKAHPLFFDLLLQVLGEGRLTDASGRLADFSSAVVLMTSNLGAEAFQRPPVGFERDDAAREAQESVLGSVRDFFRPELIGRIDRVVPFGPLDQPTLERIARRQLDGIARRDGVTLRSLDLSWDDRVAAYLALQGYDPRYGARPLRRAIERELLAPLAAGLNVHEVDKPLEALVSVRGGGAPELKVEVGARGDLSRGKRPAAAGLAGSRSQLDEAVSVSRLRRVMQRVRRQSATRDLINDIFRLERLAERLERQRAKGRPVPAHHEVELARLPELIEVRRGLDGVWGELCELEDHSLLRLYRPGEPAATEPTLGRLEEIRQRWDRALLRLYCVRFPSSDRITLAVYAEDGPTLAGLTGAYRKVIRSLKLEAVEWRWFIGPNEDTGDNEVQKEKLDDERAQWPKIEPTEGALGLAFEVRGPAAFPTFSGEGGLHVVTDGTTRSECLVHCSEVSGADYEAPKGIERRQGLRGHALRRSYDLDEQVLFDKQLDRKVRFGRGRTLAGALAEAIELNLGAEISRRLIEP